MDYLKKVALVAACDRNNYGDILLPIVFETFYHNYGSNKAEFVFYALSDADMTEIGGRKTKSFLTEDNIPDIIIIAGGQVLTAQYYNMYLNLQTNRILISFLSLIKSISFRTANLLCKYLLRGKNELPWSIIPTSNQKIYYNAVGGRGLKTLPRDQIREIDYLITLSDSFSVRDQETYNEIRGFHKLKDFFMLPDTAIIISLLFPLKCLKNMTSSYIDDVLRMEEYYVIQINKKYGSPQKISNIIFAIKEIYRKTKLRCVLLPIGRAQGHEDDIPLQAIKSECEEECCYLGENNSIYDTMFVISNSKAFLGTSLHGMVTAAAYIVPHSIISKEAKKTISYVDTWKTTECTISDTKSEIVDFVINAMTNNSVLQENIENMQAQVCDYFQKLIAVIDSED